MNDQSHFQQVFRFLVWGVVFAFAYFTASTFLPIPHENRQTANMILTFLMGTVVGGAYGYLSIGNPNKKDKDNDKQDPTAPAV